MKHTFKCGIEATSNNSLGDDFLRGMISEPENPKSITDFGHIDEHGILRVGEFTATQQFYDLLRAFIAKSTTRGYVVETWTDNARNFDFCVRLRKQNKNP